MTELVLADRAALPEPTALRAMRGMLARDFRVLRKDIVTFVARTAIQPLLLSFVFAVVLPAIGSAVGAGRAFSSVLLPGLIASTTILNGLTGVTMSLLNELSYTKEIEDRALTPASVRMLGVEKILWGAVQSLVSGLVVVPVALLVHAPGQGPSVDITDPALLIALVLLLPLLASSIGLLLGSVLDGHKFNVLISFIIVPAMMLGCVYFPWAALGALPWLQVVVLVNPIVYASEGLRAALISGTPHMPVYVILPVIVGGIIGTAWVGLQRFERRVIK